MEITEYWYKRRAIDNMQLARNLNQGLFELLAAVDWVAKATRGQIILYNAPLEICKCNQIKLEL